MIIKGSHKSVRTIQDQRAMVEYQRFNEDYFSGCDVAIYFGDVFVDEIVSLQFDLTENVAPIYGYASYTFDTVARGNRIIQGAFQIAFKESYYIHAVTNQIQYNTTKKAKTTPPFDFKSTYRENTIESLLSAASKMGDSQFENLSNEYEKSLWGKGNAAFENRVKNQETDSYFYPDGRQSNLHKNGFNIMVAYGPINRQDGKNAGEVESTVKTISGVQITGVRQVIEPSGRPILEEYSFLARDLDGDFTKQGK